MWTVFHLLRFVSISVGCVFGVTTGAEWFGVIGGVVGAIAGVFLGSVVGYIPEFLILRSISHDLRRKSTGELREYLHGQSCLTPNIVLLELKQRGEDINSELPIVFDLLESEEKEMRSHGWAALVSAFPELAQRIGDYCIGGSVDDCRRKTEILRVLAEPSSPPNSRPALQP